LNAHMLVFSFHILAPFSIYPQMGIFTELAVLYSKYRPEKCLYTCKHLDLTVPNIAMGLQ